MGIEQLTNEKFVNLVTADYKSNDGKDKKWSYATRHPVDELPSRKPSAVFIGATVNGRLCVIKEFRVPIGCYQYSIPAGLIDNDENLEETIKRELFEETNLELEQIVYMSGPLASSPGITDEVVKTCLVKAKGKPSVKNASPDEDIEVKLMDEKEVGNILNSGEVISLAAAQIFSMYVADMELLLEKS